MLIRALLGLCLGLLARLWLSTLRISFLQHPAPSDPRPWVLCFFHGQQFALLRWPRRRKTAALVSLSRDGDIQAKALPVLGLTVRRGSSSRGGARGLASLVRLLRSGLDVAFAVDGPRGPWGAVHPGADAAARHAQGVLIPMGCACSHGLTFHRTWDRFLLPWPFARVVVVLGVPIEPGSPASRLQQAILACIKEAQGKLGSAAGEGGR